MKKRNPFLISLLCLAALVVLSACASKDAGRQDAVTAPPDTSEAASAPAEDVSAVSETPADTEETPVYADTKEQPAMVMGVRVWTPYPDAENPIYEDLVRRAYILTQKDADSILTIFEHAEKEETEASLDDTPTLSFQFGENCLEASMKSVDVFSGRLDGKRVLVRLDEESCDAVREIVYRYAGVTGESVYEAPENPLVAMNIWSYDTGEEFAYILTPEDSSRVIALFEGAEKEVHDVPLSMGVSMSFMWGRDYMSTSPESLDTLDGNLNGESTLLTLDAAACIELRQIITKYASPDMPNEWQDTPSAGEE